MSRMTPSLSFKTKIFKDFIYLDRGEGREKERERNITVWLPLTHPLLGTWPETQARALTGSQTADPLVHMLALNPLSHTSQDLYLCVQQHSTFVEKTLSLF